MSLRAPGPRVRRRPPARILARRLRRSQARYAALAESLVEAVYEADLTRPHRPSGVLRYYSRRIEDVLGYPIAAWLADDALFVKGLHPDDRDWVLRAHDALRERGETMDLEYRWVKPGGEVVWIEDRARIERGPDGEPLTLRGTNADITVRKRLEAELREGERRLSEAQGIARLGSWEWDIGRDAIAWSDELYRIYGVDPAAFAATYAAFQALIHPADRDLAGAAVRAAREQGRPFDYEHRIVRPDGEVRVIRARGAAFTDEKGRVVRLAGTSQDVTQHKAAEERARQLVAEREARAEAEAGRRRAEFLSQAGSLLAESLDPRETLRAVAHLAVPSLADWCAVDLVGDDGRVRRVAATHADPDLEPLMRTLWSGFPLDLKGQHPTAIVLRSGRPHFLPDVPADFAATMARDTDHVAALRRLGTRSRIAVPLAARGRTVGVLSVGYAASGRRYTDADLAVVEHLARLAALALDTAASHAAERRARAAAESARRRAEAILSSVSDAFFALDRDWRFTYANPQAEPLLDRRAEDLIGACIWDEFPESLGTPFERHYRRALESGETVRFEAVYPPRGRWFAVAAYPGPKGLSVFFHDISERRAAEREREALLAAERDARAATEAARAEAEALYAAALAISAEAGLNARLERVLDAAIEATAAKQARVVLADPEAGDLVVVASRGLALHSLGLRQPAGSGLCGAVLAGGRPLRVADQRLDPRTWNRDWAKREETRSWLGVPLQDAEGAFGVLIVLAEAANAFTAEHERRLAALAAFGGAAVREARLRADLEHALRARDEFLSIASHELKTPLAGIKGYAQSLQRALSRGAVEAERLDRGLRAIDAGADRLAALINDLLDVARLRLGRLPFEPRPVDLVALVREIAERCREHLDEQHTLHLDLADRSLLVPVDPDRIEQVIVNLLDNAAKYSPHGGAIRVALEEQDGGALVRVADEGIGLPADAQAAIFEPFGRAPNAARHHIPGMGLGLHISRSIAELHGGRLWAASPGEGRGATLSLWLPFAPPTAG